MMTSREPWWKQPRTKIADAIAETIADLERMQSDTFDRFVKLAALYDPNGTAAATTALGRKGEQSIVTENVIASNCDTIAAGIAATEVRARFMTDGADWAMQRQARHLEWYVEGLSVLTERSRKCETAFGQGSTVKGIGVLHGFIDPHDQIHLDHVYADNAVVDDRECRGGRKPKQLHIRKEFDRDDLIAWYPQFEEEIEKAHSNQRSGLRWAGTRWESCDELVTWWSYRLPSGTKGKRGYKPGRFALTVDGFTLKSEKFEDEGFPIVRMAWSEREDSWYGIGLAERIAGHQRTVNKMNWQVDRQLDQWAIPTQFVRPVDAAAVVRSVNRAGAIVPIRGEFPRTVIPQAVSGETYTRLERVKTSASEESGTNRLQQYGAKPGGLESGEALREFRDQSSQRHAMQEKVYERGNLDACLLLVSLCKRLGDKAPVIMRRTRFGAKKLSWSKVDMKDVRVQIAAASTLAKTPAGRTQFVLELAQAGVITQDETRRLMQHPDVERALSIYTAALENLEHVFDEIADGAVVVPEPYMNLKMCVWRGQQQYLQWQDDGAPEEVLEVLRGFITQAADIVALQQEQAEAAMAMNGNMPAEPPPVAALAPQAMNLRAS